MRYAKGSGFFRTMMLPHSPGPTALARMWGALRGFAKQPALWARAFTVKDFARSSQVLLYMRTLELTLSLRLGRSAFTGFTRGLVSKLDDPSKAPTSFMPEATDLAQRFEKKLNGVAMTLMTETLMGTPTTAHILGGACIGENRETGVIDTRHRVFGYEGLYVADGSAVSANPGVNPSLDDHGDGRARDELRAEEDLRAGLSRSTHELPAETSGFEPRWLGARRRRTCARARGDDDSRGLPPPRRWLRTSGAARSRAPSPERRASQE